MTRTLLECDHGRLADGQAMAVDYIPALMDARQFLLTLSCPQGTASARQAGFA